MNAKIQLSHTFDDIISLDNLLLAWQEFIKGKRNKKDVQEFQLRLMDNLIALHSDLATGRYRHSGYHAFKINDPKPRDIHKASVRDRLLHHAIYRILYPFFDRTFIADSYSCRLSKGTHKALNRFRYFANIVNKNNTRTCWVLQGDIRKFFASINHNTLRNILAEYISDLKILGLLDGVIGSFNSTTNMLDSPSSFAVAKGRGNDDESRGLPLGNLTSQLLVNIYMNRFDQFIKHQLKAEYYIRYADDFVIFDKDRSLLTNQINIIHNFLIKELKLTLHPDKIKIKTLASGVDFLGWVNFSDYRTLRTKTKRRMFNRLRINPKTESLNSYLGLLSHGNGYKLRKGM